MFVEILNINNDVPETSLINKLKSLCLESVKDSNGGNIQPNDIEWLNRNCFSLINDCNFTYLELQARGFVNQYKTNKWNEVLEFIQNNYDRLVSEYEAWDLQRSRNIKLKDLVNEANDICRTNSKLFKVRNNEILYTDIINKKYYILDKNEMCKFLYLLKTYTKIESYRIDHMMYTRPMDVTWLMQCCYKYEVDVEGHRINKD